ncbi:ATP-dependent helicase [Catenibacillus scindens]|uniref:ATP-dependent helicase n=1 Tax=Catenibacillus scindens TaxID=673271 RepID=UPI0032079E71
MVDLKEILIKYPECLQNSIRLRATLSDLYPGQDYRAELFLIMAAYDQGIVDEIQRNTLDSVFIGRTTDRLVSAYATKRERAEAIVELWCDAYGNGVLKKAFVGGESPSSAANLRDSIILQIDGNSDSKVSLTPNQNEAVHSDRKRIAVAAGPGTGKTRVLTERIVHLIEDEHIPEDKILALSFSSKAATEMRKRLKERLGIQAYKVSVRTFHSFGLQIVRNHCNLLGYRDDFGILTSTGRNKIIRKILDDYKIPKKYLPHYAQQISFVKNGAKIHNGTLAMILKEYNMQREKANMIDFDDMVGLSLKLLREDPEVAAELQSIYSHILIDEVQDLNAYQAEIIRLLLNKSMSLFVVGDDDQCIYEWRGARPGYFRRIAGDQEFETIYLEDNFRSENSIVKLSAELIDHNENRIVKRIRAMKNSMAKVKTAPVTRLLNTTQAYRFFNEKEEAAFIADEILKLVASGYNFGDTAILIRGVKQAGALKEELDKRTIPYDEQVSGEASYDELVPVLFAITDIQKRGAISRVMNYPTRIMDQFLFGDLKDMLSLDPSLPTYQAFEIIRTSGKTFENSDIFCSRFDLLTDVAANYKTMLSAEVLDRLYAGYKAEPPTEQQKANEKIEHLKKMIDIARDFDRAYAATTSSSSTPLKDFLEYITMSSQDESAEGEAEFSAVKLMTCHKSKGLEFPVVFIPGVQVGIFPNEQYIRNKGDIESERRLFYVSMTRAIDKLYLTCNADPFVGGGLVEKGFLAEIPGVTMVERV